jgi:hypothetical protein
MNIELMKRIIPALKIGGITAFWIFISVLASCAFAYITTEEQVNRIYRFAGWCALLGFLVQALWTLLRRPKY